MNSTVEPLSINVDSGKNPVEQVKEAYRRIDEVDRPEIWISLAPQREAMKQASEVANRIANGEKLPLAGYIAAVKDNIDVKGFDTTAGSRRYAYTPDSDSVAVARLRQAGAVIIGKTNLDQFATGLVGTRSPFGAVRNAWDPERISGGSSAGSAVAVALGIVDLALGTDTAGSGRVPAALNGIVGIKPTRGRIPVTGVVPACESLDCVTVFSRDFELAEQTVNLLVGRDEQDPYSSRNDQQDESRLLYRLGVPDVATLQFMAPGWEDAFIAEVDRFRSIGYNIIEIDMRPLLDAAKMLYDSAFVAERYSAVGEFIERNRDAIGSDLNTTVSNIILDGGKHFAHELFDNQSALKALSTKAEGIFNDIDALLTPTTVGHPTIAEVNANPVVTNSAMGRFTNYANLLDMSAVAIPAGLVDGLPFGVMLTARAFCDDKLAKITHTLDESMTSLFVLGAHMYDQPLNRWLVSLGGSFRREDSTAASYRLLALEQPYVPALVKVSQDGAAIEGEVWSLPTKNFGLLLAQIHHPLGLGPVTLQSSGETIGFVCAAEVSVASQDITSFGSWRNWLARQ